MNTLIKTLILGLLAACLLCAQQPGWLVGPPGPLNNSHIPDTNTTPITLQWQSASCCGAYIVSISSLGCGGAADLAYSGHYTSASYTFQSHTVPDFHGPLYINIYYQTLVNGAPGPWQLTCNIVNVDPANLGTPGNSLVDRNNDTPQGSGLDDSTGAQYPIYTSTNPIPDTYHAPAAVSVNPSSGAGAGPQLFTTTVTDPTDGVIIVFGSTLFSGHTDNWDTECVVMADPPFSPSNTGSTPIYRLWNNNGWYDASTVAENARCRMNGAASSLYVSPGNVLTASVSLTFFPAFAGAKQIYVLPDAQYWVSPFVQLGTWTVTSGQGNQPMMIQTSAGPLNIERADQPGVKTLTWKNRQEGGHYVYTLNLDNRGAYLIRLGDRREQPEATSTTPKRWNNFGASWGALDDSERSESAEYTLTSDWKPGPIALLIQSSQAATLPPVMPKTADNEAIRDALNIFNNSWRRYVIGPAIPPNTTKEDLTALIAKWATRDGFVFLLPLTEGATLDSLEPKTALEKEIVVCLRNVM